MARASRDDRHRCAWPQPSGVGHADVVPFPVRTVAFLGFMVLGTAGLIFGGDLFGGGVEKKPWLLISRSPGIVRLSYTGYCGFPYREYRIRLSLAGGREVLTLLGPPDPNETNSCAETHCASVREIPRADRAVLIDGRSGRSPTLDRDVNGPPEPSQQCAFLRPE